MLLASKKGCDKVGRRAGAKRDTKHSGRRWRDAGAARTTANNFTGGGNGGEREEGMKTQPKEGRC